MSNDPSTPSGSPGDDGLPPEIARIFRDLNGGRDLPPQVVEQLKTGLQQMEVKLGELRSKRDQLIARKKTAEAQVKVQGAIRSINVMDPTSELSRYEEIVRREEAQALGQAAGRPIDKLNIGALGNVTAQLHVHVLGRRRDDPLWPDPVWGRPGAVPCTTETRDAALTHVASF